MNPLGSLPAHSSDQFTLNKTDALKILRFVLVQLAGLFVSLVPTLIGYHYFYKGMDYTPMVIIVVNTLAEVARRFVSGTPTPAQAFVEEEPR